MWWDNCSGLHLYVACPDGAGGSVWWDVDSRAGNCSRPEDRTHRCWIREGEPPVVSVPRPGCPGSAGSIQIYGRRGRPGWHGYLDQGWLVEQRGSIPTASRRDAVQLPAIGRDTAMADAPAPTAAEIDAAAAAAAAPSTTAAATPAIPPAVDAVPVAPAPEPEPVHTPDPVSILHHFENLLHFIIATWGGRGRTAALALWRRWHAALLAEVRRIAIEAAQEVLKEAGKL
jgi:hypothetical protein